MSEPTTTDNNKPCNNDVLSGFKSVSIAESTPICDYTVFEARRLKFGDPEKKTFVDPVTEEEVVYYNVAIQYEYGTETSIIKPFLLQGPRETSRWGISTPKTKKTDDKVAAPGRATQKKEKPKYSIASRLSLANPEHMAYIEVLRQIYSALGLYLIPYKGLLKMFNLKAMDVTTIGPDNMFPNIKYPLYYKRNEQTGAVIEGEDPVIYYKVNDWSLFTNHGKNLFQIPIDVLCNCSFSYIGLYNVSSVYIGGAGPNASIQFKTKSGIIIETKSTAAGTAQVDALRKLGDNDESSSALGDQLRAIKESMAKEPGTTTTATNDALGTVEPAPQPPVVHPEDLQNYQPIRHHQQVPQAYTQQQVTQDYSSTNSQPTMHQLNPQQQHALGLMLAQSTTQQGFSPQYNEQMHNSQHHQTNVTNF